MTNVIFGKHDGFTTKNFKNEQEIIDEINQLDLNEVDIYINHQAIDAPEKLTATDLKDALHIIILHKMVGA